MPLKMVVNVRCARASRSGPGTRAMQDNDICQDRRARSWSHSIRAAAPSGGVLQLPMAMGNLCRASMWVGLAQAMEHETK